MIALARPAALLLLLSLFTFLIAEWAPGDYLSGFGFGSAWSDDQLREWRERSGEDRPWVVRYAGWLWSAARGDFGQSLAYGIPVRQLLADRLPATLVLSGVAWCLSWVAGLLLGCAAALSGLRWIERAIGMFNAVLLSIPELVLGLLAMAWAAQQGWLSSGGVALPAAVLALNGTPAIAVHTHAALRRASADESVLVTRILGVPEPVVFLRYRLPLAAPHLLPLAAWSAGTALSSSLIVETLFGWPGLGALTLASIQARDTAVVAAVVLLSGIILLGADAAAGAVHRRLDSRLRFESASEAPA